MAPMLTNLGFYSLIALSLIHLFANRAEILGWIWHGRFLSFAAGISFAYIFVGLLPHLEKGEPLLKSTFDPFVPYLDYHAYLIALIGFLFYYGLHTHSETTKNYWLSLSGYFFFNFFLGASLSDATDPEIQPLFLFTAGMGMHYFVQDHNISIQDPDLYYSRTRWWLVAALFLGYLVGTLTHVPDAIAAIMISFLAGGVLLNALGYELPKREQLGYPFFVIGALLYAGLLVGLGAK